MSHIADSCCRVYSMSVEEVYWNIPIIRIASMLNVNQKRTGNIPESVYTDRQASMILDYMEQHGIEN